MRRRIVVSLKGVGGHGKTNFYLSMPKPLLVLSTDPNTRDVIEKVFKADIEDIDPKIVRLVEIKYPVVGFTDKTRDVMDDAQDSWDLLLDEIEDVYREKAKVMPASVALDTGTELASMNILKKFGRTDKIKPQTRKHLMGEVNEDFRGIFRALERCGVHVAVTHRVRERWEPTEVRDGRGGWEEKDQRVPGKYDRIGFREIENICNTEIICKFDPEREGKLSACFGFEVERCMIRPALVGREYWGKDKDSGLVCASFPFLAMQMYPTTTIDDWK